MNLLRKCMLGSGLAAGIALGGIVIDSDQKAESLENVSPHDKPNKSEFTARELPPANQHRANLPSWLVGLLQDSDLPNFQLPEDEINPSNLADSMQECVEEISPEVSCVRHDMYGLTRSCFAVEDPNHLVLTYSTSIDDEGKFHIQILDGYPENHSDGSPQDYELFVDDPDSQSFLAQICAELQSGVQTELYPDDLDTSLCIGLENPECEIEISKINNRTNQMSEALIILEDLHGESSENSNYEVLDPFHVVIYKNGTTDRQTGFKHYCEFYYDSNGELKVKVQMIHELFIPNIYALTYIFTLDEYRDFIKYL